MREGLYKVEFRTPLGYGYGVVYAKGGKLWGGDSGIYYVGSYTESGENMEATVSIDRHASNPDIPSSVFGVDRASITLTGKVSGDTVTATGSSPQAPGISFEARLAFLSE